MSIGQALCMANLQIGQSTNDPSQCMSSKVTDLKNQKENTALYYTLL